jgi:hypothetical protein
MSTAMKRVIDIVLSPRELLLTSAPVPTSTDSDIESYEFINTANFDSLSITDASPYMFDITVARFKSYWITPPDHASQCSKIATSNRNTVEIMPKPAYQ